MSKLLGQFAALLIFVSLWLSFVAGMMSAGRTNPVAGLLITWVAGHFLIATTMLAVGLFAVMSWDSTFPNRRDVLVLFPLPIRARTLLLAKIAAVATALGITVLSLNVFTGIIAPVASASAIGVVPLARSFAAYWIATFAAGVFIFCGVLTVQGLAQLLPRQKFLRISSFLQMAFFVLLLTVYFLQPPFSDAADLLRNQRVLYWVPSYWYFGLFQQLAGPTLPGAGLLARRALIGLAIVACGAGRVLLALLLAHAAPNRRAARHLAKPQRVTMAAALRQFLSNCRGAIQHSHAAPQPPASRDPLLLPGNCARLGDIPFQWPGAPAARLGKRRLVSGAYASGGSQQYHPLLRGAGDPCGVLDAARNPRELDLPSNFARRRRRVCGGQPALRSTL